jgi:hypothetical protein
MVITSGIPTSPFADFFFLSNPRESTAFAVEIAGVRLFCFTPTFHKNSYIFVPHQLPNKILGSATHDSTPQFRMVAMLELLTTEY